MAAKRVFFSYSHRDAELRQRLEVHLSGLRRADLIEFWHDRLIQPGQDWATTIDDELGRADIVLLLITADFIASDYCYGREAGIALERHRNRECTVIPIIGRAVDLSSVPFAHLQYLPSSGRPVTSWANEDEAWVDVVAGIRKVVAAEPAHADKPVPRLAPLGKTTGTQRDTGLPLISARKTTDHQRIVVDSSLALATRVEASDEGAIRKVHDDVTRIVRDAGLTETSQIDLGVAVMELCRNVGQHAQLPEANVRLHIQARTQIELKVSSSGPPVTLLECFQRHVNDPRLHGLGNLLWRGLLSFVRVGSDNIFTFEHLGVLASDLAEQPFKFIYGGTVTYCDRRFYPQQWISFFRNRTPLGAAQSRLFIDDDLPPGLAVGPPSPFEYLEDRLRQLWSDPGEPVLAVNIDGPHWTPNSQEVVGQALAVDLVSYLEAHGIRIQQLGGRPWPAWR